MQSGVTNWGALIMESSNKTAPSAVCYIMRRTLNYLGEVAFGLSAVLLLAINGCSKSPSDGGATASTPKEAASQLQQAFVSANTEVKNNAAVASQALRNADYEKAIQSLEVIKARQNLTLEQGMAVHNSMVSLEAKLIVAMDAGDPNAKRAYEHLKRMKRD